MSKPRATAIYVRISRDAAGEALGVARQQTDCEALAARLGWQVAETIADNDLSAYDIRKPRPGYRRLMAGLADGTFDAVIGWAADRLHRRTTELTSFVDVVERTGAQVATVQAGLVDLATPTGRMTARILGAVAEAESENKALRNSRKHTELAEAGKPNGGIRPFGYRPDRVTIDEAEADIVREVARRLLDGQPLRKVAVDLADRGVVTPTGRKWTAATLRRMIGSPRLAGKREHHGTITAAVWPPIITEADHRRIVAVLADPTRRSNAPVTRYPLAGFVVCSICGSRMVSRQKSGGRRGYACDSSKSKATPGCGKVSAVAEPVEALVADAVLYYLSNVDLTPAEVHEDDGPILAEIAALEARLDEAAEMFAEGDVDRAGYMSMRKGVDRRLDAARASLAASTKSVARSAGAANLDGLADRWPDLDFDARRAVLAVVVDKVVISPAVRQGAKFDPERVGMVWAV